MCGLHGVGELGARTLGCCGSVSASTTPQRCLSPERTVLLLVRRIPPHFFNYHPKPHTHSPTTSISAPQSHHRAQDYASRQAPPSSLQPPAAPSAGTAALARGGAGAGRGRQGPGAAAGPGAAPGRDRDRQRSQRDPEPDPDPRLGSSRGSCECRGRAPREARPWASSFPSPPLRPLCGAVPGPGSPR